MREKELRIALVCYGGVSLAVYMHGITKEIWRLAKASQLVHSSAVRDGHVPPPDDVYSSLLTRIASRIPRDRTASPRGRATAALSCRSAAPALRLCGEKPPSRARWPP